MIWIVVVWLVLTIVLIGAVVRGADYLFNHVNIPKGDETAPPKDAP